jgi:hypothetical protein
MTSPGVPMTSALGLRGSPIIWTLKKILSKKKFELFKKRTTAKQNKHRKRGKKKKVKKIFKMLENSLRLKSRN